MQKIVQNEIARNTNRLADALIVATEQLSYVEDLPIE